MLTVSEAAALLRSFDRVLILTHIRPDGDTVGCAAGLCAALRAIGKTAYLLPNPGLTENTAPYFTPYSAPADFVPEKVVSTDIATVGLFPDNAKSYADKVDLAIDHHPSFEGFGKANIVRPEAAACGEIVYDILRQLTPLPPEMPLPLYVAISTDTGCFVYSNVTANTHRVAAALMETGIDYRAANKRHFRTKSRTFTTLKEAIAQTESKGGGNLPSRNEIEEKLDLAETAEQVETIVGKMPPQRQQIFRMSRFEHMPSREIAEQLNLSVRTVDKHLELALKELRKYLNIIPAIIVFLDILP